MDTTTADTPAATPDPRTLPGYVSPLDSSFRRGNPRPDLGGVSLWDADALKVPSLSLDPGNITGLPEYDADQDSALVAAAVDAMTSLRDTTAKIIAARETARADPTLTEAAKLLAVDDLHNRTWSVATRKVDAVLASLGKQISATEQSLRGPIQSSSATPLAAEIRSYARSLSTSERQTLIQQAVNDGDAVTASAMLGCPVPYLAGLTREMQSALTQNWHVARNPNIARQLALLRKVHEAVGRAGSIFIGSFEKAVGAPQATVQRLRAQQARTRQVIGANAG